MSKETKEKMSLARKLEWDNNLRNRTKVFGHG